MPGRLAPWISQQRRLQRSLSRPVSGGPFAQLLQMQQENRLRLVESWLSTVQDRMAELQTVTQTSTEASFSAEPYSTSMAEPSYHPIEDQNLDQVMAEIGKIAEMTRQAEATMAQLEQILRANKT